MKAQRLRVSGMAFLLVVTSFFACNAQQDNALTKQEKKEGWLLLFDGKTLNGWRRIYTNDIPTRGWEVKDGCIVIEGAKGGESTNVGDLASGNQYRDFELSWEFKLAKNTNTGLKYYVDESLAGANSVASGYAFGLEYQMIDDLNHKGGPIGGKVAGLYELIDASSDKEIRPFGEWNQARIISKDNHIEHWLNGKKVLEYVRGSEEFKALVAKSKFKTASGYGLASQGYIVFQDHGGEASFKNIKIRTL